MRLQFKLSPLENAKLDFNYQYKLAGLVYRLLALGNEDLAVKYHKSTNFKFFTFSWLYGKHKVLEDCLEFTEPVKWYVSSPVQEFMEAILAGALKKPELEIDKTKWLLTEARVLEEPKFSRVMQFRTLSPILVRGFREDKENPHWDLSPRESQFFVNLQKNLVKKYEQLYGKPPRDTSFNVIEIVNPVQKRIKIKEEFYKCWMMRFKVEGNPELLRLGYQVGLGEKNSMGFGMIMVEGWSG